MSNRSRWSLTAASFGTCTSPYWRFSDQRLARGDVRSCSQNFAKQHIEHMSLATQVVSRRLRHERPSAARCYHHRLLLEGGLGRLNYFVRQATAWPMNDVTKKTCCEIFAWDGSRPDLPQYVAETSHKSVNGGGNGRAVCPTVMAGNYWPHCLVYESQACVG